MGIGLEFTKLFDDNVLTDEENFCTILDVNYDSVNELDPTQVDDGATGNDAMDD